MFTLENFYTSKRWCKFVNRLKLERMDADGNIICAHCGRPITRKYDCIGHHTIELTDENVNDYSISLNPDNVELIHFRCHNITHQRFEGFSQSVYLVYGSPCSGKTSWVGEVANDDDLILDVDRIWDAVCVGGQQRKPKRLTSNVFGIRDCIIDQVRTRTGKWRNAYIIGGYPLRSERERLCDLLRAMPVYIDATKEECLRRCETERPAAWKEYVEDWFDSYVE